MLERHKSNSTNGEPVVGKSGNTVGEKSSDVETQNDVASQKVADIGSRGQNTDFKMWPESKDLYLKELTTDSINIFTPNQKVCQML